METVKRRFKRFKDFFHQHVPKQSYSELHVPVVDKKFVIHFFRDAIRQGETQSTTEWYLNKLQCDLLRATLTWSMAEVGKVHVIGESLCLELCRLVGRASNLLDSCLQARRENLSKLIILSHTCEAFGPLILLLVRSTILIQATSHDWLEDVIEKRAQEEYEVHWQPKLIKVAHEDQMRWLAESKEHAQLQNICSASVHVLQQVSSSGHVVERLRALSIDSSILHLNMQDIELSLQGRVGAGAFGNVYKVRWRGEWCAYKEFDGAENESFEREVAVLSTLRHPHIVHFIGCLIEQDRCALVMELLDCDLTLFLKLKEMAKLDLVVALDIMLQVAQGMKYLHNKGFVHRDLKSANILVNCPRGREHPMIAGYVVKVTDFGLAKTKFKSMETLRTHNVGTCQWTAPELFKTVSDDGVDKVEPSKYVFPKKADVYSFGILCSEILTGKVPFSESQGQRKMLKSEIMRGRRPILPDTCPEFLASFIQTCWHESPDRRPEFDDICTILERFKLRALTGDIISLHILVRHRISTMCGEEMSEMPAASHSSSSRERGSSRSPSPANANSALDDASQPKIPISNILSFTMDELKYATEDFSESCKIGQGGFGTVYRGKLRDGTTVAIKRAKKDAFYTRISKEFHAELNMLAQVEHLNLVRLIGYMDEDQEHILVTEYVSNGNLRQHLDGFDGPGLGFNTKLDIAVRLNIAIDISKALTYLHYYTDVPIIHRDVKSSNILLSDTFRAKLADFGFSRTGPTFQDGKTHVSTQVKGTAGYLDPEYLSTYQLCPKSDVYSFGILLIELFTGRRPIELKRPSDQRVTVIWAFKRYQEGKLKELIDPKIEVRVGDLAMLDRVFELAFCCSAPTKVDRPNSSEASKYLWNIRKDHLRSLDL